MKKLLAAALFVSMSIAGASLAAAKAVVISINKVSQKMTVSVDGDVEYVWPVSTGAAGYTTPSGSFRPFRMEKEHFSKEWDDAPMPHSIFFTGQGHAIHGSYHVKSLGRRASHGCVRLAPANAAKLFSLVQKNGMSNTRVVVRGGFFDSGFASIDPPKFRAPKVEKIFREQKKKIEKRLNQANKKKKKRNYLLLGGL
jgi:hypothetical protein